MLPCELQLQPCFFSWSLIKFGQIQIFKSTLMTVLAPPVHSQATDAQLFVFSSKEQ